MFFEPGPLVVGIIIFVLGTLIGFWPVKKAIIVAEAKHELKQGSAGFLRSISGWSLIAFWLAGVWFFSTIVGDWGATGDLQGAMDRAWLRLRILLEILAAIAESDS